MTDNIKLPPMPKPHTPPVFATAANTQSVKAGYELGGYEKTPPLFDEHQLEAYAREAVRLNAQAVPATLDIEGLKDRLVAISSAVADSDHREAQAIIGTTLQLLSAAPQPAQPLDLGVMELAESVGLIGPASRTDDLHEAIQRFHDLIVVNASIKAARHFADGLAQQPLTDEQCDAIYTALDAWARKADAYEFGLPRAYGGGAKGGREIIRNAISGVKND